jgi:hypothetical protein
MLPFGSITSIIPLFVLGFAYVVYFCTSMLSRPEAGETRLPDTTLTTGKKEITISTDNQVVFPVISFSSFNDGFSNFAEAAAYLHLNDPDLIARILRPQNHKKRELNTFFFHFSVRPPPEA